MLHREETPVAGKMMILEGSILFVPLLILPFYTQDIRLAWQFFVPAVVSILLGLFVCRMKCRKSSSSRMVVFAWLYGFLLAAIPFLLYGNVNPVQALFESVSGFTTTGLSVLNVEKTPHIFLFYVGIFRYRLSLYCFIGEPV